VVIASLVAGLLAVVLLAMRNKHYRQLRASEGESGRAG
jgi:hypothetical protein